MNLSKRRSTSTSNTRRSPRMRTAGTAFALTAVAVVGGIAVATPASAAVLGQVPTTAYGFPNNIEAATKDLALAVCKANYPGTKSVQYLDGSILTDSSGNVYALAHYNCIG